MRKLLAESGELSAESKLAAPLTILATVLLGAYCFWARWGDLRIDCGREMYVPQALLSGKLLYKDLWYPYGPLAPYLIALSFRLFGIHLNTLYCVGLALALSFSFVLWALARRLGTTLFVFVTLLYFYLQAFQPTLFNFILPYSYAAAFGSFLSMFTLYGLIARVNGGSRFYLHGCGLATGLALLTKLEFGIACLLSYSFYLACQVIRHRSLKAGFIEAVPALPGLVGAAIVYGWFIWRLSLDFLLKENLQFSGFYLHWARKQGFSFESEQFWILLLFLAATFAVWFVAAWVLKRSFMIGSVVGVGVAGIGSLAIALWILRSAQFEKESALLVSFLAFPTGMYWICPIVLAWELSEWIRTRYDVRHLTTALLAFHAMAVGIRIMFQVWPVGHSIYYNMPVFMVFLLVLMRISTFLTDGVAWPVRAWVTHGMLAIEGVALIVALYPRQIARSEPIETPRGRIYGRPSEAAVFPLIVDFLKQRRERNETVAILPEETSLYFLSATEAPSRWYMFHPGILDLEERQRRYIADLETHHVKYILLSNRTTEEYGFPFFGLDFNQLVYAWIRKNFDQVGEFGRFSRDTPKEFGMQIYRRCIADCRAVWVSEGISRTR